MPESTPATEAKPVDETQPKVETPAGDTGPGGEGGLWEGIPEDHPIRQEVASLRTEAASKRTENKTLRETVEQLTEQTKTMKDPDEFQQAISQAQRDVQEANLKAARERAGRTNWLPETLIPLLKGETEEAITEHAQQLKEELGITAPGVKINQGAPKVQPTGGLKPATQTIDVDAHVERLSRGGRNF